MPKVRALNELTSNACHELLQIEGFTITQYEAMARLDFDSWADLRTEIQLSEQVVKAIPAAWRLSNLYRQLLVFCGVLGRFRKGPLKFETNVRC